jgi:hypothetical protein
MKMLLKDDCIKRIHVHRKNVKDGRSDSIFTVKHKGKTYWAASVSIEGPSTAINGMENPLSCGAKAWIETRSTVQLNYT